VATITQMARFARLRLLNSGLPGFLVILVGEDPGAAGVSGVFAQSAVPHTRA
jgi:hypothetical protein